MGEGGTTVVAVFDGHGGDECSGYCERNLGRALSPSSPSSPSSPPPPPPVTMATALTLAVLRLDREYVALSRSRKGWGQRGGCTANIVAVEAPPPGGKGGRAGAVVTCANSGDSRAVYVSTATNSFTVLSSDHSPKTRPDEVLRIENLGGHLSTGPVGLLARFVALVRNVEICERVYRSDGVGGLNMTRALGDDYLKPLVVPDPEVKRFEGLGGREGGGYLVVASDGLWDVTSEGDVVEALREVERSSGGEGGRGRDEDVVRRASLVLVKGALEKGSTDNVTVCVVSL